MMTARIAATTLANQAVNGALSAAEATRLERVVLDILDALGAGRVYVVQSPNGDVELLDACPRWDWPALGQTVRVGNVNGGDSAPVAHPPRPL